MQSTALTQHEFEISRLRSFYKWSHYLQLDIDQLMDEAKQMQMELTSMQLRRCARSCPAALDAPASHSTSSNPVCQTHILLSGSSYPYPSQASRDGRHSDIVRCEDFTAGTRSTLLGLFRIFLCTATLTRGTRMILQSWW